MNVPANKQSEEHETAAIRLAQKVRAGLDKGRQEAIRLAKEQGRASEAIVRDLAILDAQARRPERGRAGRIARKLHGRLSESQVQRILRKLSSVREITTNNVVSLTTNATEETTP